MTGAPPEVLTLGHSTRRLEDFLEILGAHHISCVADVRRFPASRRYPHFNREALGIALKQNGIAYTWIAELGGRRAPRADSRNTRWRNLSFRGYADYMETPPFVEAIGKLHALTTAHKVALLCAEALWWQCHRSMIADYLTARGAAVAHIADARKLEPHRYTEPARVIDGRLSYAEERLL